ncbi:hypothetical protein [Streptomyces sp. CB02923]|uniref:hypothetical protein n=1 Tax=Streptomyces sp. CB02923 TaxID=1718985 RepID=UPI0018FF7A11|nr:hypothetical protein [Streptomyces sp. CB02923]
MRLGKALAVGVAEESVECAEETVVETAVEAALPDEAAAVAVPEQEPVPAGR